MEESIAQDRISRAAAAAEQLSAVLWETLHAEAAAGRAGSVAALSQRLAQVAGSVEALAATGGGGGGSVPGEARGVRASAPGGSRPGAAEGWRGASSEGAAAEPRTAEGRHGTFDAPAAWPGATERWRGGAFEGAATEPGPAEQRRGELGGRAEGSISDVEEGAAGHERASLVDEQRARRSPEAIEVRDVRRTEGSAWRSAVQRRLARFAEEGAPFSVLVVEVLDAVRLALAQPPEEAQRLTCAIETAIAAVLRPADSLIREAEGRYWLIAPDTGAALARSLAEQLAAAAGGSASHRGAPIRVTVGIAVCPEHGRDADTLIGHADMDLYAAQAAGRSVGGFDGDSRLR